MKIGVVIIHSSKYTHRRKYVDNLHYFFARAGIDVNIIEGVFTDKVYYDARVNMHDKTITKGNIGCSLANMAALKLVIEKNYDYAFIFEDDVEINVPSYYDLKNWIDNIKIKYDLLLLTNVGIFTGIGHDGRIHYQEQYNDIYKISCVFGTQAYYLSRDIAKVMYDTQLREVNRDRIFIADGLQIHCEKKPGVFLDIITPVETELFFKHVGFENSIIQSFS